MTSLALAGQPVLAQTVANPPAVPAGSVGGMGDINLFPKRVVIEGRRKVASIGLYNKSAQTGEYDIAVSDKLMTREGQLLELESVADPAARAALKSATPLLRWSPRKVLLGGSQSQTVRVMAQIPPDLPPGEYRAHFSATAVPPDMDAGYSVSQAAGGNPEAIGVRILPRFGISIPIIVRVGQTTLSTGLKDFEISTRPSGEKQVAFTITREGTRSAFGDITITAPGAKKPLLEVKGIGVYTELAERRLSFPLGQNADLALLRSGSKLTITYTDDDTAPGQILAQREFVVP